MSNQTKASGMQRKTPVKQNRDWQKPVLDILELESANHLPVQPGGDRTVHHGSY